MDGLKAFIVAAATAAYRQRFKQKSVGIVMEPVCVAF
jgi:hypothetical protein